MNVWKRIALSYTQWNLLALTCLSFSHENKSFLVANSVFIAILTSLTLLNVGLDSVVEYLNSFHVNHIFSRMEALLVHGTTHLLPLLYTGVLYSTSDVFGSMTFFLLWLLTINFDVQAIYLQKVSVQNYFILIVVSFLLVLRFAR